jgi:hypothetical protein
MMQDETRYYTVDRIEGTTAVVIGDDGSSHDVPLSRLKGVSREDTVLRVPLSRGRPRWSGAVVDEEERRRRLERSRAALDRLKKGDPGGDIKL